MDESRMIWEQEIYFEFYINRALNDVFTFEADEAMAALYFADENEADRKVKLLVQNFTTRWQFSDDIVFSNPSGIFFKGQKKGLKIKKET